MKYQTRDGKIMGSNSLQDSFLQAVYGCRLGRMMIRPFVSPALSKVIGRFLDSKWSTCLIPFFVKTQHIDLTECESTDFPSYNACFTRKIKKEMRPLAENADALISPCDSKLSVYSIDENLQVTVKQTKYSVKDLLRDSKLAKKYEGGYLLLFRLSVDDYHRYIYVDDGYQTKIRRIPGILHTVNPAANDAFPIYKENTREYSILKSARFGSVLMMEVGAMLVGRIVNHEERCYVKRGQEKGYFAFGGSTIILMIEKDRVTIDEDLLQHTKDGYETRLRQGEKIGIANM